MPVACGAGVKSANGEFDDLTLRQRRRTIESMSGNKVKANMTKCPQE